ncbi:MAG: hypothetical protein A3I77_02360 [Gammaproteobacteria bacterium RIFCSPLOWO2_02_FULL_42_14]|nr:MAG: hypothetical protein A3B71_02200 [Gammaproteobacteria bacterium RIFCSPHIGHO2_02_FULL_42_43]OGT29002.1 MAG: hypothetical protein A2624_00150 [Gammaproteobacteria bacterium RIFCSPHIGHO2_01_FULL_42_8]OGT53498.1 MAG: hypothetical protein A3E54_02225 [Gammaproteobacteria bacterium RIFCSPHIGHO2_12_FULL_41_25]OGT61444.1 MAG: hypothetical protein A3I77_02360 [Gammaproteobacteria bacterium RIFCSPLOWO2_02_FULL_42_14]OGT86492.1 MAG: hypothetical protein A3G86_02555 [Gammaproteobacteria bacterium R
MMDKIYNKAVDWPEKFQAIVLLFFLIACWVFSFDYPLSTFIFHEIFPYDQKRILQISLLLFSALLVLISPRLRKKMIVLLDSFHPISKYGITLFLYFGIVSSIFAKIPAAAFLEWSLYFLLILFSLTIAIIARSFENKSFYFLLSTLLYIVIAAYLCLIIFSYTHDIENHKVISLFPFFTDIRFFSQFAIFSVFLLPLSDIWFSGKKIIFYLRPILFFLSGAWWTLIILNGSRAFFYSFIISAIIGLIIFRKKILGLAWRQGLSIIIGISVVTVLQFSSIFSNSAHLFHTQTAHISAVNIDTIRTRLALYHYAVQLMIEHPWFGVGPMHFAYAPPSELIHAVALAAHPHNFLLMIFVEWGIPAGIIFVSLMLSMLFQLIKRCMFVASNSDCSNDPVILASFTMSLLAGLSCAMVSGVFVMPLSQTMLSVIAGASLALCLSQEKMTSLSMTKNIIYFLCLLIVSVFSGYVVLDTLIHSLPTLTQSEIYWAITHKDRESNHVELNPRFWAQGWLTAHHDPLPITTPE